jgi:hypothetical protein
VAGIEEVQMSATTFEEENKNPRRAQNSAAGGSRRSPGSESSQRKYTIRPCLIKEGNRVVGEVRADGVFQKHLRFAIHLYRKLDAICLGTGSLRTAEEAGAVWIEIYDDETGRIFHTTIANVKARGRAIGFAGPQLALPLKEWRRGRVDFDGPQQMQLWGVQ